MYDQKKVVFKYFFVAFFLILSYLTYLLIRPFASVIIASLLLAYILHPLHSRLERAIKSTEIAAALITLCAFLLGVIVFAFIANLLVSESVAIYQKVPVADLVAFMQTYFESGKTEQYVEIITEKGANYFFSLASKFVLSIPEKLIGLFVALCILFFGLRDYEKVKEKLIMVLPFKEEHKEWVVTEFRRTMDAVVYSVIVTSLLQGAVATIGFYIFGISTPLLWGLLTVIVAMLPFVGPVVVWLPLSIYHFFTSSKAEAIGLALYCLLFVTLLLGVVYNTRVIAKKGKLHPMIALLGVIGGISVFGVSGLVLGPLMLSLFIFFLEMFFGKKDILRR